MQEYTHGKESSAPPPTEHWPGDEDLAAYIDGTLGKAESQRIKEHLADCEECFAIYMESLQFQLDSEAADEKGKVVPFPPKKVWRDPLWLASVAAAALLVVGLGWYAYQNALVGPPPKLEVAALALPVRSGSVQGLIWDHTRYRGEGEGETDLERQSFQVGALLVDFRLSAQAGDVGNASETLRSVGAIVSRVDFMAEQGKQLLDQTNQIGDMASLRRVAATAGATEKDLGDSVLIPEYVDFGKWTEAGRVAALARDPAFFHDRKNRRFLAYILRDKDFKPSRETRRELEEIAKVWDQGDLGSTKFDSLAKHFKNILDQFDFTA
jgi:hypothetical protein